MNAVGVRLDASTVSENNRLSTPVFIFKLNARNIGPDISAAKTDTFRYEIGFTGLPFISVMAFFVIEIKVSFDEVARTPRAVMELKSDSLRPTTMVVPLALVDKLPLVSAYDTEGNGKQDSVICDTSREGRLTVSSKLSESWRASMSRLKDTKLGET